MPNKIKKTAAILAALIFESAALSLASPADELIQSAHRQLLRSRYGAEAWAHLGYVFLQKARETSDPIWYDSAATALRKAEQKAPENKRVNQYLAALDMASHRFADAVRHCGKALGQGRADAELFGTIGDAHLEMGKPDSAVAYYRRMDETAPGGLAAEARWAFWFEFVGKVDSAEICLERAEKLAQKEKNREPENLAWLAVMRGEIELNKGNFSKADSFYTAALKYLPDYPLALEHKAEVKLIEKKTDEAIPLYRRAVGLSSNPALLIFLGDAYAKAGQSDSAEVYRRTGESAYRRLIEGGNPGYLRPLAELYLEQNQNVAQALRLAREDLNIRQDFGAYMTLGRVYLLLGKKKEALETIRQISSLAENDAQFCYYAGEIHLANGNKADAERLFRKTLELSPVFEKLFGKSPGEKLSLLPEK